MNPQESLCVGLSPSRAQAVNLNRAVARYSLPNHIADVVALVGDIIALPSMPSWVTAKPADSQVGSAADWPADCKTCGNLLQKFVTPAVLTQARRSPLSLPIYTNKHLLGRASAYLGVFGSVAGGYNRVMRVQRAWRHFITALFQLRVAALQPRRGAGEGRHQGARQSFLLACPSSGTIVRTSPFVCLLELVLKTGVII